MRQDQNFTPWKVKKKALSDGDHMDSFLVNRRNHGPTDAVLSSFSDNVMSDE